MIGKLIAFILVYVAIGIVVAAIGNMIDLFDDYPPWSDINDKVSPSLESLGFVVFLWPPIALVFIVFSLFFLLGSIVSDLSKAMEGKLERRKVR